MIEKQVKSYYIENDAIAILDEMAKQLNVPKSDVIKRAVFCYAKHGFSEELNNPTEGEKLLSEITSGSSKKTC